MKYFGVFCWISLLAVIASVCVIAFDGCHESSAEKEVIFRRVTAPVQLEHGGLVEIVPVVVDEPRRCFKPGPRRWSDALLPGAVTFWNSDRRIAMDVEFSRRGFVGFERVVRTFDEPTNEGETSGRYSITRLLALKDQYALLPRCSSTPR